MRWNGSVANYSKTVLRAATRRPVGVTLSVSSTRRREWYCLAKDNLIDAFETETSPWVRSFRLQMQLACAPSNVNKRSLRRTPVSPNVCLRARNHACTATPETTGEMKNELP